MELRFSESTATTPWLPIGNSDELKMASPVVTIGYPMDLSATPTFGMIGGFDLKYLNQYFSTTLIRANIAAQRGEAGAPVLNLKGEVVGILIFPIDNRTACYALPMKAAEKVRTDYVRFGEVRPGWVGVNVVESDEPIHDSTAVIQSFAEGSPGADSGLQPGDVLVRIGSTADSFAARRPQCFIFSDRRRGCPNHRSPRWKRNLGHRHGSRASRPIFSKSFPFLPPRTEKIRSASGTAIRSPEEHRNRLHGS